MVTKIGRRIKVDNLTKCFVLSPKQGTLMSNDGAAYKPGNHGKSSKLVVSCRMCLSRTRH